MAEHPYFTRSKDSKDSFPNQSLSKGKEKMTEKSVDISLTEFTVMNPIIVEQNKLIAQLRQQVDEMRAEIQETREMLNLAIATKPPLYVPTPDPTFKQFPHSPPTILKPLTIDSAIPNPHCASSSYQMPPPLQNSNNHNSHTFLPALQITTQGIQNPLTTQPTSSKVILHTPMLSESYLPVTTFFEPNHYKEKEKEWSAKEYGLTTGKITQVTTQTESSGLLRRKREDDLFEPKSKRCARFDSQKHSLSKTYPQAPQNSYHVFSVQTNSQTPQSNYQRIPPNYQAPLPNYQNTLPRYRAPQYPNFQIPTPAYQNPRKYCQVPLSSQSNAPRPNNVKKPPRVFTPLVESRTQLFERLKATGLIQTIDPKNINVNSRYYKPELSCAYHSGGVGHTTEDCINLKHKIQDLIDQRVITFQIVTPNANGNPMPNNEGLTINTIESEED